MSVWLCVTVCALIFDSQVAKQYIVWWLIVEVYKANVATHSVPSNTPMWVAVIHVYFQNTMLLLSGIPVDNFILGGILSFFFVCSVCLHFPCFHHCWYSDIANVMLKYFVIFLFRRADLMTLNVLVRMLMFSKLMEFSLTLKLTDFMKVVVITVQHKSGKYIY